MDVMIQASKGSILAPEPLDEVEKTTGDHKHFHVWRPEGWQQFHGQEALKSVCG